MCIDWVVVVEKPVHKLAVCWVIEQEWQTLKSMYNPLLLPHMQCHEWDLLTWQSLVSFLESCFLPPLLNIKIWSGCRPSSLYTCKSRHAPYAARIVILPCMCVCNACVSVHECMGCTGVRMKVVDKVSTWNPAISTACSNFLVLWQLGHVWARHETQPCAARHEPGKWELFPASTPQVIAFNVYSYYVGWPHSSASWYTLCCQETYLFDEPAQEEFLVEIKILWQCFIERYYSQGELVVHQPLQNSFLLKIWSRWYIDDEMTQLFVMPVWTHTRTHWHTQQLFRLKVYSHPPHTSG